MIVEGLVADGNDVTLCRLFCKMVRKIFIYTSEEVKKMKPRCKLSAAPSAEAEEARTRVDAACIQKQPKAE